MAEERTLALARAEETGGDPSKEELQRRMDKARDSITNTVTEIKENVSQQVESVKDALDWREHFKRQPVAWSLGATGVGFFVGYGIAAAARGGGSEAVGYTTSTAYSLAAQPPAQELSAQPTKANGKDDSPSLLERFRETSAYERLSKEAGSIGDRLVEELSTTAQQVVLPALLNKIKGWIGLDLSEKTPAKDSGQNESQSAPYEPAFSRSSEF